NRGRRTIGYHLVKSAYGQWLPGDEAGHWSTAWDERIGYLQPHMLHPGDPVRKRMAEERMTHPPVCLDGSMIAVVIDVLGECESSSPWTIAAASIEATHMHLLLTYGGRDIHRTAKWLAQRTTKAVHQRTDHAGPVWCKGKWCGYVFDESHWWNAREYIERHNVRRGVDPRPYAFIAHPRV
ncbi:MAG: transposase, partial [Planctomycetota bacterium]|nr:transposase [Planctomycetota bacterium]